ncbi:MAG: DUF1488 family protein [Caldimonas sp.]
MDSSATFDPTTGVIGFSIQVAGKPIDCKVTEGWLRKTYGAAALDGGTVQAFTRLRAVIDAAAMRSWLASRGAEPVWLKQDHIWRQPSGATQAQVPEQPSPVASGS